MPIVIPAPVAINAGFSGITLDASSEPQHLEVPLDMITGDAPSGREYAFLGVYLVSLQVDGQYREVNPDPGANFDVLLGENATAGMTRFPYEFSADQRNFSVMSQGATSADTASDWSLRIYLGTGELLVTNYVLLVTSAPSLPVGL